MILRFLWHCLFLAASVSLCVGYTCQFTDTTTGDKYDLSQMENYGGDYDTSAGDGSHTYILNVCRAINDKTHCTTSDVAVCQYKGTNAFFLGKASTATLSKLDSGGQGVKVWFQQGQGDNPPRQTFINFLCAQTDGKQPGDIKFVGELTPLKYYFEWR
eukprot:TRINITY_DN2934_c0_g1_i2.p1 TRINITY_DN2934_c0_g1~~TRINITY_DN2934_c0_g1_i2.p1  ORF type:complete len:158 (-),score=29.36 TRINITY_DN2934_c0_g1_i2:192-665(-)